MTSLHVSPSLQDKYAVPIYSNNVLGQQLSPCYGHTSDQCRGRHILDRNMSDFCSSSDMDQHGQYLQQGIPRTGAYDNVQCGGSGGHVTVSQDKVLTMNVPGGGDTVASRPAAPGSPSTVHEYQQVVMSLQRELEEKKRSEAQLRQLIHSLQRHSLSDVAVSDQYQSGDGQHLTPEGLSAAPLSDGVSESVKDGYIKRMGRELTLLKHRLRDVEGAGWEERLQAAQRDKESALQQSATLSSLLAESDSRSSELHHRNAELTAALGEARNQLQQHQMTAQELDSVKDAMARQAAEIRTLKESVQRLSRENQTLKDQHHQQQAVAFNSHSSSMGSGSGGSISNGAAACCSQELESLHRMVDVLKTTVLDQQEKLRSLHTLQRGQTMPAQAQSFPMSNRRAFTAPAVVNGFGNSHPNVIQPAVLPRSNNSADDLQPRKNLTQTTDRTPSSPTVAPVYISSGNLGGGIQRVETDRINIPTSSRSTLQTSTTVASNTTPEPTTMGPKSKSQSQIIAPVTSRPELRVGSRSEVIMARPMTGDAIRERAPIGTDFAPMVQDGLSNVRRPPPPPPPRARGLCDNSERALSPPQSRSSTLSQNPVFQYEGEVEPVEFDGSSGNKRTPQSYQQFVSSSNPTPPVTSDHNDQMPNLPPPAVSNLGVPVRQPAPTALSSYQTASAAPSNNPIRVVNQNMMGGGNVILQQYQQGYKQHHQVPNDLSNPHQITTVPAQSVSSPSSVQLPPQVPQFHSQQRRPPLPPTVSNSSYQIHSPTSTNAPYVAPQERTTLVASDGQTPMSVGDSSQDTQNQHHLNVGRPQPAVDSSGMDPPRHNSDRTCPVCGRDFTLVPMSDFQSHVYQCFDEAEEEPETMKPAGDNIIGSGVGSGGRRECPVCSLVFGTTTTQEEFERHVHCHFGEEPFDILHP